MTKTWAKYTLLCAFFAVAGISRAAVVTNWVADPGFEGLADWNHPNVDTSPWFAVRETSNAAHAGRESDTNLVYAGDYSLRLLEWGDAGAGQDLMLRLDTNAIYEVNFAVMNGVYKDAAALTNDMRLDILFNTSAETNGTYVWRHTLNDVGSTTNDVWENKTVHFTAADLIARGAQQDDYVRVVFRKGNKATPYTIFVDDIELGEYVPAPAAPGILLGFHSSKGANPDYAASGIGGTLFAASFDGGIDESAGSSDGTYGTLQGATVTSTGFIVREGSTNTNSRVDVRIENNTGDLMQLDSISFDYGRWFEAGPQDVTLSYAYGDLNEVVETEIFSATNLSITGKFGDYHDFDVPLTNLNDVVLANGEQATFRFSIANAAGPWDKGTFDNIAILGSTSTAGWFVDSESVTSDQVKLVVYTSGDPGAFALLGRDDLVMGDWAYVPHSDDGVSPYVVTNLSHSTPEGENRVIYVEASDAKKFYGLQY